MQFIDSFLQFASSAHPYVQALLVLGAALVAALFVLPLVAGAVKFLTRKTQNDTDDKLIAALNKPVFYLVLLVGAIIALPMLGLPSGALWALQALVKTCMILVVSQGILRSTKVLLDGAADMRRLEVINEQTLPLFNNLSLIVIVAGALYAMFLVWGIDVTAWLASAGIIGIAVGFAAKDTLSNIISGIFILTDKPYSIGDFVVLGSGTTGIVSDVGLRSTRIRTFDDEEVTIPNASIANEEIINKTTGPDTGRVKVNIGVAYGTNLKQVEELLLDIMKAHELVLDDPEPSVRFTNFGESSLDFVASCRVRAPLDVYTVQHDLRHRIIDRFAEANIEIPFPQRDVNLKKR
ncbi:mechanosensitive ion channel protein [bacterium]|nr:mechanosensitive ion channel protein [bacterium]|tara:strand:- start:3468 stop:4517 length:1050 start_codon:yes stop_codon:yes gene_type:complete